MRARYSLARDPLHTHARLPVHLPARTPTYLDAGSWNCNFMGAKHSVTKHGLRLASTRKFYHETHRPTHFNEFATLEDADSGVTWRTASSRLVLCPVRTRAPFSLFLMFSPLCPLVLSPSTQLAWHRLGSARLTRV